MLRVQIRLSFGNICASISLIHTNTEHLPTRHLDRGPLVNLFCHSAGSAFIL